MKSHRILGVSILTALAVAVAACHSDDAVSGSYDTASYNNAPSADEGNAAPQYPENTPSASDNGNNRGSMQQMTIVDGSVPAASIAVPAGWQAQGGINWNRDVPCTSNQMKIQWQATSADGSEAFEIMPGFTWQVQGTQIQMNPCPAMPLRTAQDFLRAVVQQQRPGARILQYRDRPVPQPQGQSQYPQTKVRSEAGEILIGYQANGQDVREVLSTSVMFTELQGNIMGGVANVTAMRAPNGRLDIALAEKIGASMKADAQWLAAVGQASKKSADDYARRQSDDITRWHNRRMAAINAKGAGDRAAIRAGTARDIANIYSQINSNTSATDDVIHRRNLEAIGGYNTYSDPTSGNSVRADIQYDTVHRLDDGSYVGTNDPYYNPAGSTELERQ